MKFQILCLATKALLRDNSGALVLFEDGKEAGAKAKELTEANGTKWQPRRIAQGNWRKREAQRLLDGSYMSLPWANDSWVKPELDHFAHVSQKYPGKVSFTLNEANGDRDIQTAMRAGRYLTKFYGDILSPRCREIEVARFAALHEDGQLMITMAEDEIVDIYTSTHDSGAGSCMSHPERTWTGAGFHPARIYAAGDLGVAYLSIEGHITARAVVWPAKKTYSRVYGDVLRLTNMLEGSGYEAYPPCGAKLQLRFNQHGFAVCPYIDKGYESGAGQLAVRIVGDHLEVCSKGDRYAIGCSDYETALTGLHASGSHLYQETDEDDDDDDDDACMECHYCGSMVPSNEMVSVYRTRSRSLPWCQSCIENHAHQCSDFNDRYVDEDYTVPMDNGDYYWTQWRFDASGGTCDYTGYNYPLTELSPVRTRSGIQNWSNWARDEYAVLCTATSNYYCNEALVELPDGHCVGFNTEAGIEFEGEHEDDCIEI